MCTVWSLCSRLLPPSPPPRLARFPSCRVSGRCFCQHYGRPHPLSIGLTSALLYICVLPERTCPPLVEPPDHQSRGAHDRPSAAAGWVGRTPCVRLSWLHVAVGFCSKIRSFVPDKSSCRHHDSTQTLPPISDPPNAPRHARTGFTLNTTGAPVLARPSIFTPPLYAGHSH